MNGENRKLLPIEEIIDNTCNNDTFKAVIVLNNSSSNDNIEKLISSANLLIIADGAANRLIENKSQNIAKINFIVGDFDSISESSIDFMTKNNITLERSSCQDTTDLQKCFVILKREVEEKKISSSFKDKYIFVIGSSGGRADHSYANLNASNSESVSLPEFQVINVSLNCLTYFLNSINQKFDVFAVKKLNLALSLFNDIKEKSKDEYIQIKYNKNQDIILNLENKGLIYKDFTLQKDDIVEIQSNILDHNSNVGIRSLIVTLKSCE